MHHTVDKAPIENDKKIFLAKNTLENKTGTSESYKPVKIRKDEVKKYETWK